MPSTSQLLRATALATGVVAGLLVFKPLPAAAEEFHWLGSASNPSLASSWMVERTNPFRVVQPTAAPTYADNVTIGPYSQAIRAAGFSPARKVLPVFAANTTYAYNSLELIHSEDLGSNPTLTISGHLLIGQNPELLLANQVAFSDAKTGSFLVKNFGMVIQAGGSITSNGITLSRPWPTLSAPFITNNGDIVRRADALGENGYLRNTNSAGVVTNNATGIIHMGITNAGTLTNNGGRIDGAIFNTGTVVIDGGTVTGKAIGLIALPEASTNAGAFTIRNGASLAGGLTMTGGTAVVSEGASLSGGVTLSGGTFTNTASTLNWYTAVSSTVNGPVTVTGGTFNNQAGTLIVAGSTLDATGAAFVNGNVVVGTGGTFNNKGIAENAAGDLRRLTLAFASGSGNTEGYYGTLYTNLAGVTARIKGTVNTAGTFNNDGLIEGTITQTDGVLTNGPSIRGASVDQQYLNGMIRGTVAVSGGTFNNYGSTGSVTLTGGAFNNGEGALVAGSLSQTGNVVTNRGLILHDTTINGGGTLTNYETGALRNTILISGTLTNKGIIGLPANGLVMSSLEIRAGGILLNFGGASVYGAINASGDIFSNGQITGHVNLSGGTFTQRGSQSSNIVMTNNARVVVGDNFGETVQTLSGAITGSGSFTKETAGNTVVLSGANTYDGATHIKGGTVRLDGAGTLGSGAITIRDGGTLAFNKGDADITISSQINAMPDYGTATFNLAASRGIIKKSGAGTLTIDGANNVLGGFDISGGRVVIGPNATMQPGQAGSLIWGLRFTNTADTTATLDLGSSSVPIVVGDLTGGAGARLIGARALFLDGTSGTTNEFGGALNGFVNIDKIGNSTTVLSGTNTIRGTLKVSAGTIGFTNTASFGQLERVELTDGNSNNGTNLVFNNAADMAVSAPITGTGNVVKSGNGVLTLSGTSTYTGRTTINAGTLAVATGGSIATTSEVFLSQGASLGVDGKVVIKTGRVIHDGDRLYTGDTPLAGSTMGFTSAIDGNIIVARDSSVVFQTRTDVTVGKVIAGEGGLIKEGDATLTLTGVNTYSGTTTISAGKLVLGPGGRLSNDSTVFVATGAEFDLGSGSQTIKTLSGTGDLKSDAAITVNSNADQTFQGGVAGTDNTSFVKDGAGNLTVTGNMIYGGTTTVLGGTLTLGGVNDLEGGITIAGHGSRLVLLTNEAAGGATIRLTGSVLSLANAQTYTSDVVIASATSQLEVTTGTATLSGVISQDLAALAQLTPPLSAGPVEKIGAGTLVLTGTNTYSGATTISAGTLSISSSANLGNDSATNRVILNGGTLNIAASLDMARALTVTASGGTLNSNVATAIQGNGNVFTGQLTKSGTGRLSLTGNGSGAGGVNVTAGQLMLGDNTSAGTGTITLQAGTVFGATQSGLTFANAIALPGAGVREFAHAALTGQVFTLGGVISGDGGLRIATANRATNLTGDNTFTGGVDIAAGTIGVGSNTALGTGTLTLAGTLRSVAAQLTLANAVTLTGTNATFDVGTGQRMSMTGAIAQAAAGAGFRKTGAGTLVVASALTNDGLITVSEGTLALTNGLNALTGGVSVSGTLLIGATGAAGGAANTITTTGSTIALAHGVDNATRIIIGSNTTKIEVAGTDTATQSGVLSQTGGARPLEKTGTGTLTLTTANTYSGATTISAGTVNISQSANLGDGSATNGLVLNGGALNATAAMAMARTLTVGTAGGTLNNPMSLTFSGTNNVFAGTLTKTGAGALVLDGTASGAGGITVAAGVLALGTGSSAGTGPITLAQGTQLRARADGMTIANNIALPGVGTRDLGRETSGQSFTLSGAISGEGGLRKAADGTVNLTGNNTFSGGFSLQAGTLGIGGNTALGTGALAASGGATLRALSSVALANSIVLTPAAAPQFTIDTNGFNMTLGGAISSSAAANDPAQPGLTKAGAGDLILNGVNSYRGATIVHAGRLIVNGSIASSSSVTIGHGASLSGNATIPHLTVHAGATVSPGNSIGTINVGGNFALDAGSTTVIELQQGLSDRILAGGTVSINGTLQVVALGGPYKFTTPYTVISGAGGRSGTFSTVNVDRAFGIGVLTTVSYDANAVLVTLSGAPLTVATTNGPAIVSGHPRNTFAVASGLDRALARGADTSPFYNIYSLQTREALAMAVNTLSGEVHASSSAMGFQSSDQFLRVMLDPTIIGRDVHAGLGRGASIWGAAYGQTGRTSGENAIGSARRSASDWNMAFGADVAVHPTTVIGIAASGGQATSSLAGRFGNAKADVFQFGLNSMSRFGAFSLNLAGSWSILDVNTDRTIPALGAGTVKASYRAQVWSGRAEAAYAAWRIDETFALSPFVAVQASSARTPGFVEKVNGGIAPQSLVVSGHSNGQVRGKLGIRLDFASFGANNAVKVYARAAWAHYFTADAHVNASLAGLPGSSFKVVGARPAQNSALLGLGADVNLGGGLMLGAGVNAELGSRQSSIGGSAKLRMAF